MPHVTGPELCTRIREVIDPARYVYAFLCCPRNDPDDIVTGMLAGADDYIVKPFHKHVLKVRLRAAERVLARLAANPLEGS